MTHLTTGRHEIAVALHGWRDQQQRFRSRDRVHAEDSCGEATDHKAQNLAV
jgi:hypothetical protein